jgi:tetratricopeptide (TPR) repeat protein
MTQTINTAIIDSVSNSRAALRSHINTFAELQCQSFSQPEGFIKQCYESAFHLLICNYEFDSGKNSTNVICELQQSELLSHSCGKIIITSDTSPNAIGQMLDLEPDVIMMRPYQIAHLQKNLRHYLQWRAFLAPCITALDEGRFPDVISQLLEKRTAHPQFHNDIDKLCGRLYLYQQDYANSSALYQQVLSRQPNTVWARWGLLKSQFMCGAWQQCKRLLSNLLEANIIKDKAYEWLACVAFAEAKYSEAEEHINRIKTNDLSLSATKLKVQLLCLQKRIDEAIQLLDRKRKANTMLKEQFRELTYEMAKCYVLMAQSGQANQKQALETAKQLVVSAGRGVQNRHAQQRRDAMYAHTCVLLGEVNKAKELLAQDSMQDLSRASLETLQASLTCHSALGQTEQAQEIFSLCQDKAHQLQSPIDNVMQVQAVESLENNVFDKETRAKQANQKGTEFYQQKNFAKAMHFFYKAKHIYPAVPAFSLNLATCLYHCEQEGYRECQFTDLVNELEQMPLSKEMAQRLGKLTHSAARA